jgi:hypothetical protein
VSSVDGLRLRRVLGRDTYHPPTPFGPDGWQLVRRDHLGAVIVTVADHPDGVEWVHASISRRDEDPSYADLKTLHRAAFGEGWAYQVFAPPAEHVNIHEHVLHLFGRLDGAAVLPDMTCGSGSF